MIRHSIAFRGANVAVLGLLGSAALGCSSNLGDAIRPKEGTASEALGQDGLGTCEADYAKPLVIDISPEDRGDLEAKLKQGGPVVRFDCKSMKVLPTCRMKNVRYSWVGYTPKAQLVEMESGDDLGAALPLNGMSFKAALERSGRLNLATMTVGQRSAGMMAVDRENLEGDCDEGTHVINSVWVGAFKLETGSKGEVMAAADVFGAEAHAGSKSERKSMNSDGDVKACESAKEDASSPPSGCTAFVRLELLKIPPKGSAPVVTAAEEEEETAGGSAAPKEKEKEKPVSCPPGRTWNGVFCASAKPEDKNVCNSKNLGVCRSKCDKKDGAACYQLYMDASFNEKDDAAAKRFSEKACEAGEERGCQARGFLAMREKDEAGQINWFSKGCFGGHASSCSMAGDRFRLAKEFTKAFTFTKRACDLGDAIGCDRLAITYIKGEGTAKDVSKGVELFEKQCRSGKSIGCTSLAREYESGKNLTKDFGLAEKWFKAACALPNGSFSCMQLGDFYDRRKDKTNADKAYNTACDKRVTPACTKVGRPAPSGPPPGPPPGPSKPPPPPPKGPPPAPPKAKSN
jgi:hypothetical protein